MITVLTLTASALLLLSSGSAVLQKHSEQYNNNVVDFISNNFNTFVHEYNISHDDSLEASKIVRTTSLENPFGEDIYYFDFDDGYMVASNDYKIYEISNIDPAYEDDIFNNNNVYYDGSVFYAEGKELGNEDNNIALDGKDYFEAPKYTTFSLNNSDTNEYNSEDGEIPGSDINDYISVYYPDYNIVDSSYIEDYQYVYQYDNSIYLPYSEEYKRFTSEGNCVINATMSMLYNMALQNWNRDIYEKDNYFDYTEKLSLDKHYYLLQSTNPRYILNSYTRIGYRFNKERSLENMSDLYLKLRDKAIEYGYSEVDGMQFSYAENMAEYVQNFYGYDSDFYLTNDYNSMKDLILSDIPCLVSANNSLTYQYHAMAVRGYIMLQKTSGWWIFTSTDTKWLLAVDDGYSYKADEDEDDYFYDPNRAGGARFICANKSTLDYSLC